MSYENNSQQRNSDGVRGRHFRPEKRREGEPGDSVVMFEVASDNRNAPVFRVFLTLAGCKYELPLWEKQGNRGRFWAGAIEALQDERGSDCERGHARDDRRERDDGRHENDAGRRDDLRPREDNRIRDNDDFRVRDDDNDMSDRSNGFSAEASRQF